MSWKTILKSLNNKDMRTKLLKVVLILLVFRALAHVPIPLAEPAQLKQLLQNVLKSQQVFGFVDILSGGALANFSIMLLGLGPYINASIIMQLLGKSIPKLEELGKDGDSGRRKLNQYTRILTLPLALMQSVGYLFLIRQSASSFAGLDFAKGASMMQWAVMIASVVGGSMLLMWLGELVTEQGVGNGISLLIFAGIASQLPKTLQTLYETAKLKSEDVKIDWFHRVYDKQLSVPISRAQFIVLLLVLMSLAVAYIVVKLNEATRVVTLSYAKRVQGGQEYGGVHGILPIKLITAGVVPIIFSLAFLSVPYFIGQLLSRGHSSWMTTWGPKLTSWFQTPGQSQTFTPLIPDFTDQTVKHGFGLSWFTDRAWSFNWFLAAWLYIILYFVLVYVFTYFYTSISFNSKEIAENLQKSGAFIPDVRPGLQTEKFLSSVVGKLTFYGALSLGGLAIMPIIVERWLRSSQFTVGGTSILILVSVALETLRQIESRALMVTYDGDTYEYDDYSSKKRFKIPKLRRKARA
jgi:preprotein translocase subunit SecY